MYAVIDKDSGKEISYHNTAEEAIRMIAIYENADGVEGNYVPDTYDWKVVEDEDPGRTMMDITPETKLVDINREIDDALKGTGLVCRNSGNLEKGRFIVRLVRRDGSVVFEASDPSWRNAMICVHTYIKNNLVK